MEEHQDRTEQVDLLDERGVARAHAACRYTIAADGWHGMLSDIRPSRSLEPGEYGVRFADGREARLTLTAFSPRDLRRAYFSGEGPAPIVS